MKYDFFRILTTVLSIVALGASGFAIWSVRDLRNKCVLLPGVPTVLSGGPDYDGGFSAPDYSVNPSDISNGLPNATPTSFLPGDISDSFSSGATTSMFINSGGSDIGNRSSSDVIVAYIGDELSYYNTSLGFKFSLPSKNKALRVDDTGVSARKADAFVWLWFTKDGASASATFFVTSTKASSLDNLSFDYNFIDYPRLENKISRVTVSVLNQPAFEETVAFQSNSPGYPNIWRFVHIIRDDRLYSFGVQIQPHQAVNVDDAMSMLRSFENSFYVY